MELNTTPPSKTGNPKYEFLKRTTYLIVALVVVLIIANLILNQMIPLEKYGLINSDGSVSTATEMRKMNVRNTLLMVPVFGFVLGAILSFIPFKKMAYREKYLRVSLLVLLVLYVVQFVSYLKFT